MRRWRASPPALAVDFSSPVSYIGGQKGSWLTSSRAATAAHVSRQPESLRRRLLSDDGAHLYVSCSSLFASKMVVGRKRKEEEGEADEVMGLRNDRVRLKVTSVYDFFPASVFSSSAQRVWLTSLALSSAANLEHGRG